MDMNMKEYVNWKMSHDVKFGEAEGYPLVLENCRKNKDLKNFRVYGNSVQDGEPTPENPIEIKSVGELTTKNLLGGYDERIDGYYNDTGDFVEQLGISTVQYISVKPNTAYTITGKRDKPTIYGYIRIVEFNNDKVFVTRTLTRPLKDPILTITTTSNTAFLALCYDDDKTTEGIGFVTDIQIEEGSTATEYEPYHKYKIPVTARGKNLFNPNLRKNVWSEGLNLKYLPDEDCFVINGTVTEGYTGGIDLGRNHANLGIKVKSGKYYKNSVVFLGGSTSKVVNLYSFFGTNSTGEGISPTNWEDVDFSSNVAEGYTKSITSLPNGAYISSYWVYLYNVSGVTFNNFKFRVMLTETNATSETTSNALIDYEPYIEPQTFNIYLDEPLRKLGDYADYVDFNKGVVIKNIQENVYNGNEDWKVGTPELTNTYIFGLYSNAPEAQPVGGGKNDSLCNKFATRRSGSSSVDLEFVQMYGSYAFIRMNKSRVSSPSVDEIKNWLSENPITINYVLVASIEEPIDLPELPKTQAKTMIYEVIDTTIKPSNMYSKYIKKY